MHIYLFAHLCSFGAGTNACVFVCSSESLIAVVVCAVLITLGLVLFLVWRQCAASERPLPRSLVLDLHECKCVIAC